MFKSNYEPLSPEDISILGKVRFEAQKKVFSLDMVKEVIEGKRLPAGADTELTAHLRNGQIKVVYSLEEQPLGLCKHASVSWTQEPINGMTVPPSGKVKEILEHLGFRTSQFFDFNCWYDKDNKAMNYLQKSE